MSLYTQEVVCSIMLEATNKMHDIIWLTEYWMGIITISKWDDLLGIIVFQSQAKSNLPKSFHFLSLGSHNRKCPSADNMLFFLLFLGPRIFLTGKKNTLSSLCIRISAYSASVKVDLHEDLCKHCFWLK